MHSATTYSGCMFCGLYFPPPFGVPMVEHIRLLLYGPHASALVALPVAMALFALFFLSLILFAVQARWMLAMVL